MCRQRRVCEYLGRKCTHRLSILSLPPSIRHQIYKEADTIISDGDIDLGRLLGTDSWAFETSFGDTFALLQTNRTIYAEVSAYIYSTNRFFIHYRTRRSLQPLRSLSPNALASLRHLTIHLNTTSCEAGHSCCHDDPCRVKSCADHDRPLGLSTTRDQLILDEWSLAAAYIFGNIPSSKLHFYFVCDVSTPDAAQRVLAPFSTAPPLASCAIRLARGPDPILQKLAQATALRAMGRGHLVTPTANAAPFRFLALPPELRKHILSFTDLVSPLSEIQYSPTRAYHLHYSTSSCGVDGPTDCCPASIHHACAFRDCRQRAEGCVGCFCGVEHAAFWTACRCWRPPAALFLVSKAVLEVAREVFFGANRFVIVPEDGGGGDGRADMSTCDVVVDRSPERMHAAVFLTQVVPRDALRHLRFLEVVFPPFRTPWMLAHEPAYRQWQDAIGSVRDHLTLPALTLRVYFADKSYPDDPSVESRFRVRMTKTQAMEIYRSYFRVVKPLQGLKGLNRLFVHVAWPWRWTEVGRRGQMMEDRDVVEREVWSVERQLERMVMGNGYDGKGVGKRELGMSQWMHDDAYA